MQDKTTERTMVPWVDSIPDSRPQGEWAFYRNGIICLIQETEARATFERWKIYSCEKGGATFMIDQLWNEIDQLRTQLASAKCASKGEILMPETTTFELQRRIDEAAAILQAAPDIIGDNASKNQASKVATANRVAWAILTTGRYPESVRYQQKDKENAE